MANENVKKIDIGDLTESVTAAVQRVLQAEKPASGEAMLRRPRIICGIIFEPEPSPWIGTGGLGGLGGLGPDPRIEK